MMLIMAIKQLKLMMQYSNSLVSIQTRFSRPFGKLHMDSRVSLTGEMATHQRTCSLPWPKKLDRAHRLFGGAHPSFHLHYRIVQCGSCITPIFSTWQVHFELNLTWMTIFDWKKTHLIITEGITTELNLNKKTRDTLTFYVFYEILLCFMCFFHMLLLPCEALG